MKVSYKNRQLEKICTNYEELCKKYRDTTLAYEIYVRIDQLHNFAHLKDLKYLRDANLHPLKGKRKYELAIDVQPGGKRGKWRIILEQCNGENISDDRHNDAKFETVTEIKILEISEHYKK